ncbi:inositol monophosphatase family protein [Longimicrobium terrae]|uniref:Inositol-1-monophosphatase n=1 Tax=Longimicrobium terrae TaxID=1639882 RepID=A0A841H5C1_9BACT|nr:myo-inositol-1(or 4)-monophosphatase [Longimicrobium terrae]MBB6073277.1 myo-inositol-1(or 4)-monophosphatase [Longimicrobium terrae]NNC28718.1 inositol monophosphatase [Longimicrobium terrae]
MTAPNPPSPFAAELAAALHAAAGAAELILARGGAANVRHKGRADLVTEVDEAAERLITERLLAAFPADRVVGEEFSSSQIHSGRRWYVDPVDGTTNFVHGHPFVCVSIALWDDDGPAAAVIHAPLLGEVYHAVRGGGAFRNGEPIGVSAVDAPSGALLATGFPFKAGKGDLDAYMRLVADAIRATHDIRRDGSAALDLAMVASGRVDGYFEIGLAPWDCAAGMLLVTEAGGRVSGWPGDEGLPLHTGRVLATNGRIHDWLAELTGAHVGGL